MWKAVVNWAARASGCAAIAGADQPKSKLVQGARNGERKLRSLAASKTIMVIPRMVTPEAAVSTPAFVLRTANPKERPVCTMKYDANEGNTQATTCCIIFAEEAS